MSLASQASPSCTCAHPLDCVCACHARHCDPEVVACDLDFLPDEGGLTVWGCDACTPGQGEAHLPGCPSAFVVPRRVSPNTSHGLGA